MQGRFFKRGAVGRTKFGYDLRGMVQRDFLVRMRETLGGVFAERFQGLLLYGSEARGQSRADSDIDLLVLLRGPVQLGADLNAIIAATYPMQLELDRPLHVLPVNWDDFNLGQFALYRNAKKEGVLL